MTEQPAAPAGKAQATAQSTEDAERARVEKMRADLAEAEAKLPAPPGTVRLRVRPPHDSFTAGGFSVGAVPSPVPAIAAARLMSAAADAGVIIEEA